MIVESNTCAKVHHQSNWLKDNLATLKTFTLMPQKKICIWRKDKWKESERASKSRAHLFHTISYNTNSAKFISKPLPIKLNAI
jgi:hypothetical protein